MGNTVRRAAKVDGNHKEIVEEFRRLRCSVVSLAAVGGGVPDLLVGFGGRNFLVEVKLPKGKVSELQKKWYEYWEGYATVVRSIEEVRERVRTWEAYSI